MELIADSLDNPVDFKAMVSSSSNGVMQLTAFLDSATGCHHGDGIVLMPGTCCHHVEWHSSWMQQSNLLMGSAIKARKSRAEQSTHVEEHVEEHIEEHTEGSKCRTQLLRHHVGIQTNATSKSRKHMSASR